MLPVTPDNIVMTFVIALLRRGFFKKYFALFPRADALQIPPNRKTATKIV